MKISLIAAFAEEGVIGKDGKIPWTLKEDLKHFRNKTEGCGEKIYEEFLPLATKMYLTKIDIKVNGDTFFPSWNKNEWKELSKQDKKDVDQGIEYWFLEYERK